MNWLNCLRNEPIPEAEENSKKQAREGCRSIQKKRPRKMFSFWGMAEEEILDDLVTDVTRGEE